MRRVQEARAIADQVDPSHPTHRTLMMGVFVLEDVAFMLRLQADREDGVGEGPPGTLAD